LIQKIDIFINYHNNRGINYVLKVKVEDIILKVERARDALRELKSGRGCPVQGEAHALSSGGKSGVRFSPVSSGSSGPLAR
jgi:hypothetical protein